MRCATSDMASWQYVMHPCCKCSKTQEHVHAAAVQLTQLLFYYYTCNYQQRLHTHATTMATSSLCNFQSQKYSEISQKLDTLLSPMWVNYSPVIIVYYKPLHLSYLNTRHIFNDHLLPHYLWPPFGLNNIHWPITDNNSVSCTPEDHAILPS